MSKIISVTPLEDYKLLVDFETGSSIAFNMGEMVKTIPFARLQDLSNFRRVAFEEKTVYWPVIGVGSDSIQPLRLTVDTMLFSIRD